MAILFEIRQGDSGRTLSVQVQNADGSAIPAIPGGSTVTFTMVAKSGHRVTGTASVSGAGSDVLNYVFASGDTAKAGRYDADFTVTYSGGAVETFPTSSDAVDGIVVEVCPAL